MTAPDHVVTHCYSIVILDKVVVPEQFRGRRLGLLLAASALETLGQDHLAVCYPAAFEMDSSSPQRKTADARNRRVWRQFGFSHFKGNVFWLDTDLRTLGDNIMAFSEEVDAAPPIPLDESYRVQIEEAIRDGADAPTAIPIPLSAAALCKSPSTLATWAQAAIKIERDALGMAEPGKPTTAAGEPDSRGGVDTEVRDVIDLLSDEQRMQLHDVAIDSVRLRCQQRARLAQNLPVDVLAGGDPVTDASDPSAADDDITDAEVVHRLIA